MNEPSSDYIANLNLHALLEPRIKGKQKYDFYKFNEVNQKSILKKKWFKTCYATSFSFSSLLFF